MAAANFPKQGEDINLPPRNVEGCDNLKVRRGRGVREESFLEGLEDLIEIIVGHENHRSLPQRQVRSLSPPRSCQSGTRARKSNTGPA